MTIRDQLVTLAARGVRHVVVGGQAAVMRQAIDFALPEEGFLVDD
jgi:hypothetical protein